MGDTIRAARGKWRGILMSLGIDRKFLQNKHGPCPLCGGKDRFRFDDKEGEGTWICNVCGAGRGINLLMSFRSWDFRTAANEIDQVVGSVRRAPARKPTDDEQAKVWMNKLWQSSHPLREGDPAHKYLAGRVSLPSTLPACLRFNAQCPCPDKKRRPALIALAQKLDGDGATLHRTFLGPNGKADMENPRALMPGRIDDDAAAAVRLFPVHGERLGIAEGIETAFAAAARFRMPVWAALTAPLLEKWSPPASVKEVTIFGDNDPKFGGQKAAFALAHRLAAQCGLTVTVQIPRTVGTDWADREAG